MMETIIELTCECGKNFNRRLAEHNRSLRLNRKSFCSRRCQGKANLINIPIDKRSHPENLTGNGRKRDELSPFRIIVSKCSNRNKDSSITPEELKVIWERQNGTCPFTGWNLLLRESNNDRLPYSPNRASLDRIDNSKGYTSDNVQFVAMIYQFAKNAFDDSAVQEFCRAVINQAQQKSVEDEQMRALPR